MHNIEALEKQWKRYQMKKYFSSTAIITVLIIAIVAFNMLFDSKPSNASIKQIVSDKKIQTAVSAKSKEQKLQTQRDSQHIKNIKDANLSTQTIVNNGSKVNISQNIMPILASEQPRKKIKVDLEQTASMDSITNIILRFYESKDPNDSLFLATKYYEQNDYDKAFFWAVETNKITEDIEDSWIIMAKSKAKMGDTKEAIRILRAYVAKKDSKEASNLLGQMEGNQW